jgi:hypothetical protein
MPSLERYPGLQSPLEQSKKSQEKTRPLRELRAQFETLDKLFGVETTLLPDGTLHVGAFPLSRLKGKHLL